MYKQKGYDAGNKGEPAPSKEEYNQTMVKRKQLKNMLMRPGMSEEAIKKTQQELNSLPKYKGYVVGKGEKKG